MRHAIACLSEVERLAAGTNPILLATGFDGVLCPIADSPSSVAVPPTILKLLRQLIRSHRVAVAVISSRMLDDLTHRLPLPLIFGGNHGLEIRGPAFRFEQPGARHLRPQLAEACQRLSRDIARWGGAWIEDRTLTATVHYGSANAAHQASVIRAVRHLMAEYGELFAVELAPKAVEIHPRIGWNKGSCLTWIKHRFKIEERACICIGNEPSDEWMFAANHDRMNIKVGSVRQTLAKYYVRDAFEVAAVLAHLAQAVQATNIEPDDSGMLESISSARLPHT